MTMHTGINSVVISTYEAIQYQPQQHVVQLLALMPVLLLPLHQVNMELMMKKVTMMKARMRVVE